MDGLLQAGDARVLRVSVRGNGAALVLLLALLLLLSLDISAAADLPLILTSARGVGIEDPVGGSAVGSAKDKDGQMEEI